MMPPRMLAFDLDGTLLGPDGEVSPRVAASVRSARAAGFVVAASTGRPWPQTEPSVAAVGGMDYGVCLNGAIVIDAVNNASVVKTAMSPAAAVRAAGIARAVLGDAHLGADLADGRHYWERDFAPHMPIDIALERTDDAIGVINGPVLTWLVGSTTLDALEVVAVLADKMPDGIEVRPSGLDMAEIVVDGVSKASGLAVVAERHGISADEVMAFGDGLNDLEMLSWAGHPVAMENGADEAKALATRVAPSNADDGVAVVVDEVVAAARG